MLSQSTMTPTLPLQSVSLIPQRQPGAVLSGRPRVAERVAKVVSGDLGQAGGFQTWCSMVMPL